MRASEQDTTTLQAGIIMVIVLVLAVAIVSAGCINRVMQTSTETGPDTGSSPALPAGSEADSVVPVTPAESFTPAPLPPITPLKSEAVKEVAPILTPDPYPIMHGTQINSTSSSDRFNRRIEFKKTYHLTGGAEGLLVNVPEGPLYILYVVTPQNDCLKSPDSCKGDFETPVQRPYMTITVRDNATREIVAEDGYAREFSSDTGNYEFSYTSKNTADTLLSSASYEDETTTSSPGPRYIPIYKEGAFHITIEGAYVDVNVVILAGPTLEDMSESVPGVTPTSGISPEEMFG